jgi:cytochrome P450
MGRMAHDITLAARSDVEAALADAHLVPPPAPPSIGSGATAALRAAMARFSSGQEHPARRAAVVALLDQLEPAPLRRLAAARAAQYLAVQEPDDVGYHVPVPTLAAALGLAPDDGSDGLDDFDGLTGDVRQIVEVIGRGARCTAATDAAADRLLRRFADHPGGPIPVISVLYQAHDATAALLASTLDGRATSTPRRPAVTRTVRTAVADTEVGHTRLPAGAQVVLDLGTTDLEFGAGPHHCPGAPIALALVAGILDALPPPA